MINRKIKGHQAVCSRDTHCVFKVIKRYTEVTITAEPHWCQSHQHMMVPYRNSPRLQNRCWRAEKVTWRRGSRPDALANRPAAPWSATNWQGDTGPAEGRTGSKGTWQREEMPLAMPLGVQCFGRVASGSADQLWAIWEHEEAPPWHGDTRRAAALGKAGDNVPGTALVLSPDQRSRRGSSVSSLSSDQHQRDTSSSTHTLRLDREEPVFYMVPDKLHVSHEIWPKQCWRVTRSLLDPCLKGIGTSIWKSTPCVISQKHPISSNIFLISSSN